MLYTTVLFLEFTPVVLERFKWMKTLSIMQKISIPIMIVGIILSTLHQSSLGSLFLILPEKMHPLWFSELLPVYFYLSAIGAGFAMVIFESFMSARAFNKQLEMNLLSKAALISVIVLMIGLIVKLVDFALTDKLNYLVDLNNFTLIFYLEILIGTIAPFGLMLNKKLRNDSRWLYVSTVMIVAGFIFNRMNVSITSLGDLQGINYFPSFNEISITIMLVMLGMWAFKIITKHFPVFHKLEETAA
jgi:Ni/Fe-hydrogenase subunit HybB-like protein